MQGRDFGWRVLLRLAPPSPCPTSPHKPTPAGAWPEVLRRYMSSRAEASSQDTNDEAVAALLEASGGGAALHVENAGAGAGLVSGDAAASAAALAASGPGVLDGAQHLALLRWLVDEVGGGGWQGVVGGAQGLVIAFLVQARAARQPAGPRLSPWPPCSSWAMCQLQCSRAELFRPNHRATPCPPHPFTRAAAPSGP